MAVARATSPSNVAYCLLLVACYLLLVTCDRSSSRVGSRTYIRNSDRVALVVTSLLLHRGPPLVERGIEVVVVSLFEVKKLSLYALETRDLSINLGDPAIDKDGSVATGTLALIHHVQELLDVGETQSDLPSISNESQALRRALVVDPIAGCRALSRVQQTQSLVVAKRVSSKAEPAGKGRDGLAHVRNRKPWSRVQGQARPVRRLCRLAEQIPTGDIDHCPHGRNPIVVFGSSDSGWVCWSDRGPARDICPAHVSHNCDWGMTLFAGYTCDPPPGIGIQGILLGCKPDQEVCGEVESLVRVSRPSRR
jgi:hypothetical protein